MEWKDQRYVLGALVLAQIEQVAGGWRADIFVRWPLTAAAKPVPDKLFTRATDAVAAVEYLYAAWLPAWAYQADTGRILRPDGSLAGWGYAGHGAARNNRALEGQHGALDLAGRICAGGPLPAGRYEMVELLADGGRLGANAIRLRPDDETRAHIVALDRDPDSFYWHGDNPGDDASEGCLVSLPAIRGEAWGGPVRWLASV